MPNWPLGTRPTRAFAVLLVTGFAVSLGIVRTHNNLMYLVFVILAVCTFIGWAVPAIVSRAIRVKRTLPPHAHAGSEVSLEVQVQNNSRLFSSPLLAVENTDTLIASEGRTAVVGALAPKSTIQFRTPFLIPRRGVLKLADMRLVSAYPMGLFEREWSASDDAGILAYPRVVSVRDRLLEGVAVNLARSSTTPDTEREIQSLRDYQEGDDLRRVNWKATARRDDLVVGEYHRIEKRAKVALYLDISGGNEGRIESAISMTASLAIFYHARNRLIELVTAREVITFGRSERKMKAMLRLLALLGHEDRAPVTRVPRETGSCLKVLVYSGRPPRHTSRFNLVMGPQDFSRYAPALGRRAAHAE